MLAHMTGRQETKCTGQASKMKPKTFMKHFVTLEYIPEGLTRVTTKTAPNSTIYTQTCSKFKVHFQLEEIMITEVSEGIEYNSMP